MASPFQRILNGENIAGKHRRNVWRVVGPASYVNGTGIRVDPAAVGMKVIFSLDPLGCNAAGLTWALRPIDPTTVTGPAFLRAFVQATGAEVANGVNLSTAIYTFEAIGT
jgi:hypothetical protein